MLLLASSKLILFTGAPGEEGRELGRELGREEGLEEDRLCPSTPSAPPPSSSPPPTPKAADSRPITLDLPGLTESLPATS